MKFLWCDTETTGIETEKAAPFQVAFIYVSNINGQKEEIEKIFYLNPFDIQGIEYSEEAGRVHGYSKESIEAFESSSSVVPSMAEFIRNLVERNQTEKLFFCGYNAKFDFNHLNELFKKHGYVFEKYFIKILDVFDQVKDAGHKRILPYLENRKLTTIAKFLGVDLSNAHDAMGDIKATREVAKSLANKGISLR